MTIDELITIAQRHAAEDKQHSYTKVPDFVPHDWLLAAMAEVYEMAAREVCDRLTSKPKVKTS